MAKHLADVAVALLCQDHLQQQQGGRGGGVGKRDGQRERHRGRGGSPRSFGQAANPSFFCFKKRWILGISPPSSHQDLEEAAGGEAHVAAAGREVGRPPLLLQAGEKAALALRVRVRVGRSTGQGRANSPLSPLTETSSSSSCPSPPPPPLSLSCLVPQHVAEEGAGVPVGRGVERGHLPNDLHQGGFGACCGSSRERNAFFRGAVEQRKKKTAAAKRPSGLPPPPLLSCPKVMHVLDRHHLEQRPPAAVGQAGGGRQVQRVAPVTHACRPGIFF